MTKTIVTFIIATFIVATCFAEPPNKPGVQEEMPPPYGCLGYKIGTCLTIEGVENQHGKREMPCLLVDMVGDYKLNPPVPIYIKNVDLREGVRYVFRGYETGDWVGTPWDGPGPAPLLQSSSLYGSYLRFSFRFIVTVIKEPSTAKLKNQ